MADVVALGAGGQQVGVISTINATRTWASMPSFAAQGVYGADDIPVVASRSAKRTWPGFAHRAAGRPSGRSGTISWSADTPENEAVIEGGGMR